MSAPTQASPASSKTGATFLWILGSFAAFAVLLSILQAIGGAKSEDPRAAFRLENRMEIQGAQEELISKMGLADPSKASGLIAKTVEALKAKKPGASAMVVPGSPTQLKQAASAVPATPAAATPASAPAVQQTNK